MPMFSFIKSHFLTLHHFAALVTNAPAVQSLKAVKLLHSYICLNNVPFIPNTFLCLSHNTQRKMSSKS